MLSGTVSETGCGMEVAVIGWPARIASSIEESGAFDNKVVEKITEGDDWFVIVQLEEPATESISESDAR